VMIRQMRIGKVRQCKCFFRIHLSNSQPGQA
jgi:hypothetical protein